MKINNTKQSVNFNNAMVFDMEMLNGENTSIVTIYNYRDVDFEELVGHMHKALEKCTKVKNVQSSVGSIKQGKFEPVFLYDRKEFDRTVIHENPILKEWFFK
jgi:hypothetical protein